MKKKLKQSNLYLFRLVLGKSDHLLECVHTVEGLYRTSLRQLNQLRPLQENMLTLNGQTHMNL